MEDNKKKEKVQYRTLKFISNDFKSPYAILREQSGPFFMYNALWFC